MRNFIKFLATLFVLAMLPFAFLTVLELYLTDYRAINVIKKDNFHIIYIGYFVVCLFITGIDYALSSQKE